MKPKITKSNPSDAPVLTAYPNQLKNRRIGEKESSIKGRMLPILDFEVK
ncbi:MAG: hypothetical protein ABH896_03305 [Candidatus Jacksonbacteria bacterium]